MSKYWLFIQLRVSLELSGYPIPKYSILLQGYENKRFCDEQRITLSDWLPCYPAKLRDISIVRRHSTLLWYSMTYDKKTSTIKVTSDDPKEFEQDMFAHFANVMEQVERDRANGTLPSRTPQPKARLDPRAGLREALLESYQPREMFGQECFF